MESSGDSVEIVEVAAFASMGRERDSASLVEDQRMLQKVNCVRICVHSKVKYYCKECKLAKDALIAATALLQ
jgi:hypothetical protein